MNIRTLSFVANLIVSITIISAAAPARAATAPETAERKRSQAAEAFKLNITKVYVEETEGNFKDVLMEAQVTEVLRTACGVNAGETIVIKSRRRNMTEEQVRGSIESFSEPPLVLRKGWSGSAYLRLENKTTTLKTFGIVLEGFSFIPDGVAEHHAASLESFETELDALDASRPLRVGAESTKLQRIVGDYSATIEVSSGASRTIRSILIEHAEAKYTVPKEVYDDIKDTHLGEGFDPGSFRLEIKDSAAIVWIKSGARDHPSDHAWIMKLPLESVRRITRRAEVTGYHEAHSLTPLESVARSAEEAEPQADTSNGG